MPGSSTAAGTRPGQVSGSDPSSPREMRGWLQLRKELIGRPRSIQLLRAEVKTLKSKLATHCRNIGQHLDELTGQRSCSDESLASLRYRAQAELKRLAEIETRSGRASPSQHSKLKRQLDAERTRLLAMEERRDRLARQWTAAWLRFARPRTSPVEQVVRCSTRPSELQSKIKEAREDPGTARGAAARGRRVRLRGARSVPAARARPDIQARSLARLPTRTTATELLRRFRPPTRPGRQGSLIKAARCRIGRHPASRSRDSKRQTCNWRLSAAKPDVTAWTICPQAEERSRTARELRNRSSCWMNRSRNFAVMILPINFATRRWHWISIGCPIRFRLWPRKSTSLTRSAMSSTSLSAASRRSSSGWMAPTVPPRPPRPPRS